MRRSRAAFTFTASLPNTKTLSSRPKRAQPLFFAFASPRTRGLALWRDRGLISPHTTRRDKHGRVPHPQISEGAVFLIPATDRSIDRQNKTKRHCTSEQRKEKQSRRLRRSIFRTSPKHLPMLPQQELIRHPRDVVANHYMPRLDTRHLFIRRRHRSRRSKIIFKQLR